MIKLINNTAGDMLMHMQSSESHKRQVLYSYRWTFDKIVYCIVYCHCFVTSDLAYRAFNCRTIWPRAKNSGLCDNNPAKKRGIQYTFVPECTVRCCMSEQFDSCQTDMFYLQHAGYCLFLIRGHILHTESNTEKNEQSPAIKLAAVLHRYYFLPC